MKKEVLASVCAHDIEHITKHRDQVARVLEAARNWVAYQDDDSKVDQEDDIGLRMNAVDAEERLVCAIIELEVLG